MDTQQINKSTSHLVQPSFVLTDLLQMASPQGVLLTLKNQQEVMQTFEGVVMEKESILDFRHVRVLQGGIEVDLFVMSSLASSLPTSMEPFIQNGKQQTAAISPSKPTCPLKSKPQESTPNQSSSAQVEECHEMIQEAIGQIFRYKGFWNDTLMASSPLQTLVVVQQACHTLMRERGLVAGTLSERDKASVLRDFLTTCLDQELCPNPGHEPPKNKAKIQSEIKDEWIKYLILRSQYVDGESRRQVEKELKKIGCWITKGGSYTRYVKAGRERLSALIWQKEMQTREGQQRF